MNILMTAALLAALTVPDMDTSFKAYMDYRAITDEDSMQYKLQQRAETGENGLRIYHGRYMVAMGSYYGKVGDELTISFTGGESIDVIIGDMKADTDTDATNRYYPMEQGGNVVEFIVDVDELPRDARKMGDISYADDIFSGSVEKIVRAME